MRESYENGVKEEQEKERIVGFSTGRNCERESVEVTVLGFWTGLAMVLKHCGPSNWLELQIYQCWDIRSYNKRYFTQNNPQYPVRCTFSLSCHVR